METSRHHRRRSLRLPQGILTVLVVGWIAAAVAITPSAEQHKSPRLHSSLQPPFLESAADGRIKIWVLFRRDKGLADRSAIDSRLDTLHRIHHPRAIERRALRRTRPGLFDVDDLPLPRAWVDVVRNTGAQIVIESRWLHAVSAWATGRQLERIAALPFVDALRAVAKVERQPVAEGESPGDPGASRGNFYGEAAQQLEQMNLTTLHGQGYTGAGVIIGILDTGFRTTHAAFNDLAHPLVIVAERDFVNGDPETGPEPGDLPNQHNHGTLILGTLAAYQPGVLVGAAYDASYVLAKVEDLTAEYSAEEDFFVAGLEFIEARGGDVATSSVVIFDHYTPEQLDGQTSLMAQALNIASANGLHVCQGAGNGGNDADPSTSTLVPPADAIRTITVGAVDFSATIASFSSDGPTADGRLKPELLARGVDTRTVSPSGDATLTGASGTSLSTPLTAGAVACLVQAHPDWTVEQMRSHLFLTAGDFAATGSHDPLVVRGFGIVDAAAAVNGDCNANGVEDFLDLGAGVSGDCNANAIPDECDVLALHSADLLADGLPDECTDCSAGPGCPAVVSIGAMDKQLSNVVLFWNVSANAASYSVRRDDDPRAAGSTEVDQVSGALSWEDTDALLGATGLAVYVVRGVTAGGVAGP